MKLFLKRRRKVVLAALLFCVLLAVWFMTRYTGNDVEWLTEPPAARRSRLAFLGQWKQPVKIQLLRAKYWLFGTPQTVTIRANILELDSPTVLSNLISSAAMFSNSAGVRGWIINDATAWQTSLTNPALRVLTAPTVTVADGMQAQVSVVERMPIGGALQNVGFYLDLWPHLRGDSVDLTSFLVATERASNQMSIPGGSVRTNTIFVRTNAAFGVRVHLPKGSSVFLLAGRGSNNQGKVIGALLSPVVWPRK